LAERRRNEATPTGVQEANKSPESPNLEREKRGEGTGKEELRSNRGG